MTKPRLVKQLISVLNNTNPDRDIQAELDLILTPVHLTSMTKDQKNKITRLHDFLYKYYDGEAEKTVVMYQLVLSVIRSLKPSFPVQYELKFWLNQIQVTLDRTARPDQTLTVLLHQTRAALQAKMAWSTEANHTWTGNGDIPCYLSLEEQLVSMYIWVLRDGYDHEDIDDVDTLNGMCCVALDSL